MFRGIAILIVTCVVLSSARQSPHADEVAELGKSGDFAVRFSDNILEDARLDAPGLVTKYNYPLEVHNVITSDGYILEMHRIKHGRDQNNVPDDNKPIVFLMHGLLSSSADWVLMGPGCGLGYILAEEGFDVWMGNARGNYYSRKHIIHNPDSTFNTAFWEYSWDEIGNIDLPTMIDYVLENTGKPRLHYIGHSQGTTSFFVMASLRPEYNSKIISMHALAPVAYMANNNNLLLKMIAPFSSSIESVARFLGLGEFLPNSMIMSWAGENICMNEGGLQAMCSNIMFLVGGWNVDQHNATMLPVKLGHTPAGSSVRQIAHYGQGIAGGRFRRYDHGRTQNRRLYGSRTPPDYDLGKITAPVFLHYADQDPLAHVEDVFRLWRELGRPVGLFRIQQSSFTHLDFMWAIDGRSLIYDRVINLLWAMNGN